MLPESFLVQYQLIDDDQCNDTPGQRTHAYSGTGTSATVTGLKPYSTYTIFVASFDIMCTTTESSGDAITSESGMVSEYFGQFSL